MSLRSRIAREPRDDRNPHRVTRTRPTPQETGAFERFGQCVHLASTEDAVDDGESVVIDLIAALQDTLLRERRSQA